MKTSDSILNSTLQAGGIEVKLSLRKMTLRILFLYILFMLAGSAAYVYIWEDMSAYGLGHYIGEFWGRHALFAIFLVVLIYIPLQAVLLFVANGCRLKGFRWRCNWAGAGVYLSVLSTITTFTRRGVMTFSAPSSSVTLHRMGCGNRKLYCQTLTPSLRDFDRGFSKLWYRTLCATLLTSR